MASQGDSGSASRTRWALCIPTYKRPHLLARLLDDVFRQTVMPSLVVVVDGDPASGQVLAILRGRQWPRQCKVVYVPSNHANLAYQRYLGWRVAGDYDLPALLYLDDDLRVEQRDAIQRVLAPLFWPKNHAVGVTADVLVENNGSWLSAHPVINAGGSVASEAGTRLVRLFGSSRNVAPGGLCPSGHRRAPERGHSAYQPVQWLRGGVMAYRMEALTKDCFSEDLFALTHTSCGLGEDTLLSHRVGAKGPLLFAFCAQFLHPSDDPPKAYPIQAFRFGYAASYSRRLLNDNFRWPEKPRLSDRVALVKSLVGSALLLWWHAVTSLRAYRFAQAWGYTCGAAAAFVWPPTARRLTPHINWQLEAEAALTMAVTVFPQGIAG